MRAFLCITAIAGLAIASGAAGCGGSNSSAPGGGSIADAGATDAPSISPDASSDAASAPASDAASLPDVTVDPADHDPTWGPFSGPTGTLDVTGNAVVYTALAVFEETIPPPSTCATAATFGACTVSAGCTGGAPPSKFPQAGRLHFALGTGSINLDPQANGWYGYSDISAPAPWGPGDSLAVTAEGGDIPAFSASVVSPAPVQVADFGLTIDRHAPLVVRWTGNSPGWVTANLQWNNYAGQIRCSMRASAGVLVIPQEALALAGAGPGTMNIFDENVTTITAGKYTVLMSATIAANTPQLDKAIEQVTFQ
jgi:hypothetical protein